MCRERRSTKHRRMKRNGEHIMANISRRNFMKVAAGAAGIAGLGLLNGCSKTEAPASSSAASAARIRASFAFSVYRSIKFLSFLLSDDFRQTGP